VRRSADAEAHRDRGRRDGLDVVHQPRNGPGQRRARARHADERDAVQEPAGALRDLAAALGSRRRRDEIDDRESGLGGDPLEGPAFVGCEVGHDDPRRPRVCEPTGGLTTIPAADDLVRVAHRHERDARARFGDPADELDRAGEGRARVQGRG
jgi:hypothetical protein